MISKASKPACNEEEEGKKQIVFLVFILVFVLFSICFTFFAVLCAYTKNTKNHFVFFLIQCILGYPNLDYPNPRLSEPPQIMIFIRF